MPVSVLNNKLNNVIIVAPFWGKKGHVGNYRIDRFLRWLSKEGYIIYLLRAGNINIVLEKDWGKEITIRDNVGYITEILKKITIKIKIKIFLYAWLFIVLKFIPIDEYYFWSNRILQYSGLRKIMREASFILSSSPPNSSHIAAYKLSKKFSVPLVSDLRDGWLDEPLKQKLEKLKRLRNKEILWEKMILSESDRIIVTSNIWKEMLVVRFPNHINKITVLTNAYPQGSFEYSTNHTKENKNKIKLLYVGRFSYSSLTRNVDILLDPLYNVFQINKENIEIKFLSELTTEEKKSVKEWKSIFSEINVSLITGMQISRKEMLEYFYLYDGLLLLSTSMAALPSKLFEYINSTKPILAITPGESAVWQLGESLPQLFLYNYLKKEKDHFPIQNFLEACKTGNYEYKIPEEFSEKYLSNIFMNEVRRYN